MPLDRNSLNYPSEVFFDGSFLNHRAGIGRDSRALLASLEGIYGDKVKVIYPNFVSQKLEKEVNPFLHHVSKVIGVIFALLGRQYSIRLTPNSMFVQSQPSIFVPEPKQVSHVVRLHDVFPITNPEWFRFLSVMKFKAAFSNIENRAFFLCDSFFTQSELYRISRFNCRSFVLYCSLTQNSSNKCNRCIMCQDKLRLNHFVLTISTIEPRKNYRSLLFAWKRVHKQIPKVKLVIIGRRGWKSKLISRHIQKMSKYGVVWLQNICDYQVQRAIKNSILLISSSYSEGFNFPVADAISSFKKVIISNIPVHQELYSNYAIFFDPNSRDDLEKKLIDYLKQPSRGTLGAVEKDWLGKQQFNQSLYCHLKAWNLAN